MKSIALLSSGMDSVVALTLALEDTDVELAITFDYGQLSAQREIEYSRRVCQHFGIEHRVIKLPWLAQISASALTGAKEIPELKEEELDIKEIAEQTARQVWVPNRNGVFINIAASFAEALGCNSIIVGFDAEEAETFPDNSREYVEAINRSLEFSTLNGVKVIAPVIDLNKSQIVAIGMEKGAPLEWSWSCYYGDDKPCLKCESCQRRARAFKQAGYEDPLLKRLGL